MHSRSFLSPLSLVLIGGLLFANQESQGQAEPAGVSQNVETVGTSTSPVMGFNFALNETGVHNSATGWADVVTPVLTYRFNKHIILDASVPWFPVVNAYIAKRGSDGSTELRTGNNLFGDMLLGGDFAAERKRLVYEGSTIIALPTGNVRYGLGAGSTTYNVTNHFEYRLGALTPDIEFGEGNNSSLANPSVRKAYVATGPLANFQAGGTIDLPFTLELDLEAYEDLPLGSQNVAGTVTHKGRKRTNQVVTGSGPIEDNGLNAELDLPVGRHLVLMGLYERSFVQGLDTASAGLTWTLRVPKKN